jgi:Tfp pilus assembly protein PilO
VIQQIPTPPTPPSPPFDPNLLFMQHNGPPIALLIVLAALTAAVVILWPVMRAFARRVEGKGGADPALQAELEQMRAQFGDLDTLQHRVAELEERVDFTERLLAQSHDAQNRVLRGDSP